MRKPYETDMTDDEWAIHEAILKRALYTDNNTTRGHPRYYPLREITNAIVLDGDSQSAKRLGQPTARGRRV